jgi:hypothetical protein
MFRIYTIVSLLLLILLDLGLVFLFDALRYQTNVLVLHRSYYLISDLL